MPIKETLQRPDEKTLRKRDRFRRFLAPIIQTDIVLPSSSNLQEAIHHMETGGGLIVYADHMSQTDPLAVLSAIYDLHPIFKNAPIVFPIGDHQKMSIIRLPQIARSAGIEIKPIVTDNTLKKQEKRIRKMEISPFYTSKLVKEDAIASKKNVLPKKNDGLGAFTSAAEQAFTIQGLVYSPVQPGRAEKLTPSEDQPLGKLAALALKHKIDNVGILVVGTTVDHPNGYRKARGFNLFKRHTIKIGQFFTLQTALEKSGGIRKIDRYMTENVLSHLVPEDYLTEELWQKKASIVFQIKEEKRMAARMSLKDGIVDSLVAAFPGFDKDVIGSLVEGKLADNSIPDKSIQNTTLLTVGRQISIRARIESGGR